MALEALVLGALAGSTLLQAQGQVAAGKAQYNAARFNAQVAERNAKLAEQQAEQIRIRSSYERNQFRKQFDFLRSSQGNALRYNGFEASSGTGLQVQLEMAKEADAEIAVARYNANIEKQRALNQAQGLRSQAGAELAMGRYQRSAGRYAAMGTLLSGAASMGAAGSNMGMFKTS